MTVNEKPRISKEFILISILVMVLYALSIIFVPITLITILLMSICITIVGLRFGIVRAVIVSISLALANTVYCLVTSGGIALIASWIIAIPIFSGILCAFAIGKHLSLLYTISITAIGVGLGLLVDVRTIPYCKEAMLQALDLYVNVAAGKSELSKGEIANLKELYLTSIKIMAPSIIMIVCAVWSFMQQAVSREYSIKRGDIEYNYMTPFITIQSKKSAIIVPIVSFVLTFTATSSGALMVYQNLAVITCLGLFLSGVAVAEFYLRTMIKILPLRLLSYGVLLFMPSAPMFLCLIGVVDSFMDLRHLKSGGGTIA